MIEWRSGGARIEREERRLRRGWLTDIMQSALVVLALSTWYLGKSFLLLTSDAHSCAHISPPLLPRIYLSDCKSRRDAPGHLFGAPFSSPGLLASYLCGTARWLCCISIGTTPLHTRICFCTNHYLLSGCCSQGCRGYWSNQQKESGIIAQKSCAILPWRGVSWYVGCTPESQCLKTYVHSCCGPALIYTFFFYSFHNFVFVVVVGGFFFFFRLLSLFCAYIVICNKDPCISVIFALVLRDYI